MSAEFEATDVSDGAWSRPALQRTELGPMAHVIAHKVADQIDAALTEDALEKLVGYDVFIDSVPQSMFFDYVTFTRKLSRVIGRQATAVGVVPSNTPQVFSRFIEDTQGFRGGAVLTYFSKANLVLTEGIKSGIKMPLVAHRLVHLHENYGRGRIVSLATCEFEPAEFLGTLRSTWFDSLLHELAYARNGMYGSASSDTDNMDKLPSCLTRPDALVVQPDGRGVPVAVLSDAFREEKAERFKEALTSGLWSETSGGCPVRHATFKKLGPYATAALEEMGVAPADMPTESAISRYRRLVADVGERLLRVALRDTIAGDSYLDEALAARAEAVGANL